MWTFCWIVIPGPFTEQIFSSGGGSISGSFHEMSDVFSSVFSLRPVVSSLPVVTRITVVCLLIVGSLVQSPNVLVHLLLVAEAFLTKAEMPPFL